MFETLNVVYSVQRLCVSQTKRAKTQQETATSDFDEVVSSQYESYDNDDDDDERQLAVMNVSQRLQSQNSTAAVDDNNDDDDDDDDESSRQGDDGMMMASRGTETQTLSASSLTSSMTSWPSAVTSHSHSRRKRKPSTCRRYSASLERVDNEYEASQNDINMNKVICRADVNNDYNDVYQVTDVTQAASRQDSRGYYAGEMGCRNGSQNELGHELRQTPQTRLTQYQLECDGEATVSQYNRPNDLRSEPAVKPRSIDDRDISPYDLDYDLQPNRQDEAFELSEYYEQPDLQYGTGPMRYRDYNSRQNETRQGNATLYKHHNTGLMRHRDKSMLYRQNEADADMRPGTYDEGSRHSYGKSDVSLQYASGYCEVTSTVAQRTAMLPHSAVPIKSSPGDDPDTDHHQNTAAVMNSLALPGTTGYYWSPGKGVDGMNGMGSWRAGDQSGVESARDHQSTTSPFYESCNIMRDFIKVEDSLNADLCRSALPASVPLSLALAPPSSSLSSASSLSSSSSPFCVDQDLKCDFLAERNVGHLHHLKQRRRRRHNASSTATLSRHSNTRSTPTTGTSASTSAGVGGYLPPKLPFSLPPVPPGYRLVITHRPTAATDTTDDESQVTQLIIDHPSDSTTLVHDTISQPRTSTDHVTPSTPVIHCRSFWRHPVRREGGGLA